MADESQGLDKLIERWKFANAAARIAAVGLFYQDIGKIAYQQDEGSYWRLTSINPTGWSLIGPFISSLAAARLLGSAMVAYPPAGGTELIQTSLSLTSGEIRFMPVYIPAAITITGVKFHMWTQGVFTAASLNNTVGLYSYSGGTLTQVAVSANNDNLWKAASNAWASQAFSATYNALAGLYFIGALYRQSAQTTAPALGAMSSSSQNAPNTADFANSAKLYSFWPTQTVLPTSVTMSGGLGTAAERPWAALY